ncbi:unnamed protein product [Paramecium sonneborni]|uniref:Uncharacterized protein n=1 Tax=Paramecium sonneborni TaxID=65129 RepID=A0A8S1KJB5_9CILI|nr:unnamed protein product [Paramecium sonneborni]
MKQQFTNKYQIRLKPQDGILSKLQFSIQVKIICQFIRPVEQSLRSTVMMTTEQ